MLSGRIVMVIPSVEIATLLLPPVLSDKGAEVPAWLATAPEMPLDLSDATLELAGMIELAGDTGTPLLLLSDTAGAGRLAGVG